MKFNGFLCRFAAVLALSGIVTGPMAHVASPNEATGNVSGQPQNAAKIATQDVSLAEGGTLRGFVVDNVGNAQPNTKVMVSTQQGQVAMVETDATGQFSVPGLTGGVYQVETLKGGGVYRLWAPRTAPPAAFEGAMIVQGDQVVRGANGQLLSWLGNPWVLGAIVATAIAVPLALAKKSGS